MTVYPRVGGETGTPGVTNRRCSGLSPRGRGNLGRTLGRTMLDGSIPAWAGKPSGDIVEYEGVEVYPRVGGETG